MQNFPLCVVSSSTLWRSMVAERKRKMMLVWISSSERERKALCLVSLICKRLLLIGLHHQMISEKKGIYLMEKFSLLFLLLLISSGPKSWHV